LRWLLCVLLGLALACGDDSDPMDMDGGVDEGDVDAGPLPELDADVPVDEDAGPVEAPDAGPEPCDEPGESETLACGACGEQVRFCTEGGVWEYGPCEDESGVCVPGETDTVACGDCGTQASECSDTCEWEPVGECSDEGECAPGTRSRTGDGCGPSETREVLCSDECVYEDAGECRDESCDEPGVIEAVDCGFCGTVDRFCTAAGVWEYGVCEDEGECEPGTMGDVGCGLCGTRSARCNTECSWVPSGDCEDEGECRPGSTRRSNEGCDPGETRVETCDDTCAYEAGVCEETPATDVMLLFDMTGSHAMDVDSATGALRSLARELLGLPDTHVGVAVYADFPMNPYGRESDVPFRGLVAPTDDEETIVDALGALPRFNGNDQPESGVEALGTLAGRAAHPDAEPFECDDSTEPGGCWRVGATRLVILFTDAPQHNGPTADGSGVFSAYTGVDPAPHEWDEVVAAMTDAGLRLVVVSERVDSSVGQHRRMLSDLGEEMESLIVRGDSFGASEDEILARVGAISG